jgi:Na+-driven multidrug efflux pump
VEGVRVASRIGFAVAAIVGALFVLIPGPLLGIFGMTDATDPAVLTISRQLLMYLSVSGFFITAALSYTGGLQGTGDTRSPLYISIVSQVVVPLGLCAAFQATRGLHATDIWLAIVIGHVTRATLSVTRFRQQKWRGIAVDIGAARP